MLAALAFDAAFLDIDVLDGKTFEVAALLHERGTPFAFVSGSRPEDVPPPLRSVPFLPKPYDPGGYRAHVAVAAVALRSGMRDLNFAD